ncbi:MAG: hypothetical protein IPI30_04575 [Saprospiraceae bacterium]|nr:hypothetical protein [Candidatus Vicinibacter affinis]
MTGADNPDRMSKFRPSKVINSGMALCANSQKRAISTGILMVCKMVKVFMSKLSINFLPFEVKNSPMIKSTGGNTNNKNLGGRVAVTR